MFASRGDMARDVDVLAHTLRAHRRTALLMVSTFLHLLPSFKDEHSLSIQRPILPSHPPYTIPVSRLE